jgi:hypothetical protein
MAAKVADDQLGALSGLGLPREGIPQSSRRD